MRMQSLTDEELTSVVLQPDGKIVVLGDPNSSSNSGFLLLRFNTNGSLGATFGTGGIVRTPFGGDARAFARECRDRAVLYQHDVPCLRRYRARLRASPLEYSHRPSDTNGGRRTAGNFPPRSETAVKGRGKLGRISNDAGLVETICIERLADGADAPVHHIAWGHQVRAGGGVRKRSFSAQLDRLVI